MMRIVLICLLVIMLCFPVKRLIADSRVVITSDPSGASVTLDGNPIGQTPLPKMVLPPGAYRLEFQLEGHQTQPYLLEITDDGLDHPVHVEFPTGSLHIESHPADAIVYVDDNRQPQHTPLTISVIAVGTHTVRVEKAGFGSVTKKRVSVEADKTASISVTLPRLRGTLTVSTQPSEAEVMLDGESIGKTPITRQVSVGKHHLRLSKPNYDPIEEDITIVNGQVTKIVKTLPTTNPPDLESGTLVVNSTPPGAMVYLDQTLVGPTPQNKPVDPGSHVGSFNYLLEGGFLSIPSLPINQV